jgi:hypothetical protein
MPGKSAVFCGNIPFFKEEKISYGNSDSVGTLIAIYFGARKITMPRTKLHSGMRVRAGNR